MVGVGIIDFATAPPLGVLQPVLDTNGPYGPGLHTLTTATLGGVAVAVADTFGALFNFNGAIPPKLGLQLGYSDGGTIDLSEFNLRLLQVAVQHQFLTGQWVVSQLLDVHVLPVMARWTEALPGRIGLYVSPGIAVDIWYLRV